MSIKFISPCQKDKYTEEKLKYRKNIFKNKIMKKKYFFSFRKVKKVNQHFNIFNCDSFISLIFY